jgi:hypothetical protein
MEGLQIQNFISEFKSFGGNKPTIKIMWRYLTSSYWLTAPKILWSHLSLELKAALALASFTYARPTKISAADMNN